MLKIVTVPNPVLTSPTKNVKTITPKVKKLVEAMKKTLVSQRDPEGVGLAATQVGESLNLFIMKPGRNADFTVCINPEIKMVESDEIIHESETLRSKKSKNTKMEGCLSIPRIWAPLKRKNKVMMTYEDLEGTKHEVSYEGFEAIIVQHEVDHLKGILFTQRCLEQNVTLYEENGDDLVAIKA